MAVDDTPDDIGEVLLTADIVLPDMSVNTDVDFYLSNNGGSQWFKVIPDSPFNFPTMGSDLRWRAELHSLSPILTPKLNSLSIDIDTDGDGVFNLTDTDDDNDGLDDTGELLLGSDPEDDTSLPTPTFSDLPVSHNGFVAIELLARNLPSAIVDTCDGIDRSCPDQGITRDTAAIWLNKANGTFTEPAATGTIFIDVADTDFAAGWIENLHTSGYTEGCEGTIVNVDLKYCPGQTVSKESVAKLMLIAQHGRVSRHPPQPMRIIRLPISISVYPA